MTYGWQWWVIFVNFRGIFNDVREELLMLLLLGIYIDGLKFAYNGHHFCFPKKIAPEPRTRRAVTKP